MNARRADAGRVDADGAPRDGQHRGRRRAFAEEARKIHYGETEERGIRGQASREETESLLEEGIGVLPLPVPKGLKGPLQ
jgi:hypothetical protein